MDPSRRCTAHAKQSGERCKRAAIPHGTVCVIHGGKAPWALAKAEERMRSLIHPAISSLKNQIDKGEFPATKYVLDWAGFKAIEKVQADGEVVHEVTITFDRPPTFPLLNGHVSND